MMLDGTKREKMRVRAVIRGEGDGGNEPERTPA